MSLETRNNLVLDKKWQLCQDENRRNSSHGRGLNNDKQ